MDSGTATGGSEVAAAQGSREYASTIRDHLRADILQGRRAPGSQMSQAGIAAEFGVSRGPVREAFRLLESEGLIDARVNHRARIADLSVEDLEHVYTLRVVNESLALSVSVPQFSGDELDELDGLAMMLADPATHAAGFDSWDQTHQRFHTLLLAHSGPRMLATAAGWAAHTRRYRRAYVEEGGGWSQGAGEHADLARLCRERRTRPAAQLLALHLSRAALTLIAGMAPTHEPVLLRAAIRQVSSPLGCHDPSGEHTGAAWGHG